MRQEVVVHVMGGAGARVALEIHQFLAGGLKTEYADNDGYARFDLDTDAGAEVTLYVNGTEKVSRGSIKSYYQVSA
jgi:hypothetical protein